MFPSNRFPEFKEPWAALRVSDLGSILSGGTPKTSVAEYWDGEILWATPTDITKNSVKNINSTSRTISGAGLKSSSANLLPAKSLLICSRATVGEIAINRVPMSTNQGFKNIVPDSKFDVDFLYYLLSTKKSDMLRRSAGSTFLEISKREIEKIKVNTPPLEEQRKIAACLSTWDKAIDAHDRLIALKEQHKLGLMQAAFSSSNTPSVKLGTLATFKKGKGLSKKHISADGVPCIHYGQLFTAYGSKVKTVISRTDTPPKNAVTSNTCDVLMPTSDVTPTGLSTATMIPFDDVVLGGDILVISPLKDMLDSLYLSYFINNSKSQILGLASGTTVFHIYAKDMSKLNVILPPIEEQRKIATCLSAWDDAIDLLTKKRDLLKQQKQGLMQQLLG